MNRRGCQVPKGKEYPERIRLAVINTAVKLQNATASNRWPTEPEVREELQFSEDIDRSEIPPVPTIYKMLADAKKRLKKKGPKHGAVDSPWSLGASDNQDISRDANGALITVWAWTLTTPGVTPFTIRIAIWIDKLRWIEQAGGNSRGEAVNPAHLYGWAVQYAGREWKVDLIKDGSKGMRSGVLDAQLMLGPNVGMFAKRIGLVTDDTGIDHSDWTKGKDEAFTGIDPMYATYLRNLHQYEATREVDRSDDTSVQIDVLKGIWDDFENYTSREFWLEYKDEAHKFYNLAVKKLMDDGRFWLSKHNAILIELLGSLFEVYKEERMHEWNPDIEQLIQKYLPIEAKE